MVCKMRAHRGRGLCILVLQSSKHEPCLTWVGALICCALTFGPACEVSVSLFILDSFLWTSYRSFKLLMTQTDINIYHTLTPVFPGCLWYHPHPHPPPIQFTVVIQDSSFSFTPQSVLEKVLGTSLKSISFLLSPLPLLQDRPPLPLYWTLLWPPGWPQPAPSPHSSSQKDLLKPTSEHLALLAQAEQ